MNFHIAKSLSEFMMLQESHFVMGLVPIQVFSEPWTDEKLYKKYDLTQDEIDFIESMIRPME